MNKYVGKKLPSEGKSCRCSHGKRKSNLELIGNNMKEKRNEWDRSKSITKYKESLLSRNNNFVKFKNKEKTK